MDYRVEDRPALAAEVREVLYPYLRAWTDERDLGEPEFDACATVGEFSDFLAAKVAGRLTKGG